MISTIAGLIVKITMSSLSVLCFKEYNLFTNTGCVVGWIYLNFAFIPSLVHFSCSFIFSSFSHTTGNSLYYLTDVYKQNFSHVLMYL